MAPRGRRRTACGSAWRQGSASSQPRQPESRTRDWTPIASRVPLLARDGGTRRPRVGVHPRVCARGSSLAAASCVSPCPDEMPAPIRDSCIPHIVSMHYIYYILYTILHTMYFIILYTPYSVLNTSYSILHTPYSVLHTLYPILYTLARAGGDLRRGPCPRCRRAGGGPGGSAMMAEHASFILGILPLQK